MCVFFRQVFYFNFIFYVLHINAKARTVVQSDIEARK